MTTDWLANISIQYILIAVIILFLLRMALKRYSSPSTKYASEMAESLLIAIVLVFLVIRPFMIQAFYIPSGSMRPTLLENDRILVNKFVYRFKTPTHGDIVVFKSPPNASSDGMEYDFIKRLMAMPGDVVEVKGGKFMRNGEIINESYLSESFIGYTLEPFQIPEGQLFVLGDNRNNSNDSHEWGTVSQEKLVGKAMVKFWPPGRIGLTR